MLSCVGDRCCTSTKAAPVSAGRFCSNCRKASRPPAEAPIPTIGKIFWREGGGVSSADERFGRGGGLFLFVTMTAGSVAEP